MHCDKSLDYITSIIRKTYVNQTKEILLICFLHCYNENRVRVVRILNYLGKRGQEDESGHDATYFGITGHWVFHHLLLALVADEQNLGHDRLRIHRNPEKE